MYSKVNDTIFFAYGFSLHQSQGTKGDAQNGYKFHTHIAISNETNCDRQLKDKKLIVSVWYPRKVREYYITGRRRWTNGSEHEYVICCW